LECGAAQDVLHVCGALSAEDNASRKALLDRIVAMLTKLGQRGYAVFEEQAGYAAGVDSDTDSDPDTERSPFLPRSPPELKKSSDVRLEICMLEKESESGSVSESESRGQEHGFWS
jgi:hypothetical protein